MSAFTRQHYNAVAETLLGARKDAEDGLAVEPSHVHAYVAALGDIARDLASFFAEDNPRFDRARFLGAAGVTE